MDLARVVGRHAGRRLAYHPPMTPVRLVTVTPGPVAAVHRRTTFPEVPRVLLAGLDPVWKLIRARGLTFGHNVAVYRPLGGGAVELTCAVQVAAPFDHADAGEVVCSETPGGDAATATHVGPYARLGETYDAVVAWVRTSGRRLAGVNWEIYGDWSDDPAKVRTDVFHLLKPR